ncbi:hypothetical protein KAFR_0J01150 [Kazachstania africana CBS 2517]|uniref:Vacuolar membrane protein n=1 Tax=Kazachstania africana (strain ATCC 22294 / BCRC 22015 / CBS 2517 / CECT 1963 / NBRC 1671 / NRRL Y-8276) TaxID=1071382 RepID=H2B0N2_KAZAF|nr:hypothetical protein KAFR_0J01150 [Kazachstania africana CBS 2517]CCF60182.1 hypothetical protein KAFR_0J01150 [Kazachstania africana CBS 2517]
MTELIRRSLPQLTTTATTTSAAADDSSSGSVTEEMPSIFTTTSGNSTVLMTQSSSTISSVTPTITPPSAEGNPHIFRTSDRDGTVFIAVGACAAMIFLAILIWWSIVTYISHRNTKRAYYDTMEKNYDVTTNNPFYDIPITNSSDNGDDADEKLVANNNRRGSKIALFGANAQKSSRRESWDSIPNASAVDLLMGATETKDQQFGFNSIQDNIPTYYNRNSLFISPTFEVSKQKTPQKPFQSPSKFGKLADASQGNQSTISLVSTDSKPGYHRPERAASPERKSKVRETYHRRNQSSLSFIASPSKINVPPGDNFDSNKSTYNTGNHINDSSVLQTPTKPKRFNGKPTASSFLDNMLGDEH